MGYPTEVIQKALSEPENNPFKVAYQLVVDHKRLLQDCKLFKTFFFVFCF